MCNFTTTYHTTCKHYSTRQYTYCPLAESQNALATNSPQSCHNTTDMGLETDFTVSCIMCQRTRARTLFFTGIPPQPEPQAITYGIVASRSVEKGIPSVCVTSWVDTGSTGSGSGSGRTSPAMSRCDSNMSLASLSPSLSSISSSSSQQNSQGSYRGWSFKEGKFGNAHWRSYQDDEQAALIQQKRQAKERIALKSCHEDYE